MITLTEYLNRLYGNAAGGLQGASSARGFTATGHIGIDSTDGETGYAVRALVGGVVTRVFRQGVVLTNVSANENLGYNPITHTWVRASDYNNIVVVWNADLQRSFTYLHFSSISVNQGDVINPGRVLGIEGSTGWSTGRHTHVEVKTSTGFPVNPLIALEEAKTRGILDKLYESGALPDTSNVPPPPFHFNGWQSLAGGAKDIDVGSNGSVWAIGSNAVPGGYGIYQWTGSTWTNVSGGAVRVAVDQTGRPWVVNDAGVIFRRSGTSWQTLPGQGKDIAINGGQIWLIGADTTPGGHSIFHWNGSSWTKVSGGAVRVAVDQTGTPWVVNDAGIIFRRSGTGWQELPGKATDIDIGADGSVWVIGNDYAGGGSGIYKWHNGNWARVAGGATGVAVAPNGNPWLVNYYGDAFVGLDQLAPIPAAINFSGGPAGLIINGNNLANQLSGTTRNDSLNGRGGNDTLRGGNGNDILNGLTGNDQVLGGNGNDRVTGDTGNDRLFGESGSDLLNGGDGNDVLNGGDSNDILVGGVGADSLTGGASNDVFRYTSLAERGDVVQDFNFRQDVIDLVSLFQQAPFRTIVPTARFDRYVRLISTGSSTQVQIDQDGISGGSTFVTLTTLQNVQVGQLSRRNFVIA